MPSPKPKRFPPLSFNPNPILTQASRPLQGHPRSTSQLEINHVDVSDRESESDDDDDGDEGERVSSFEPLTLSPRKMKPPPTPPNPASPHAKSRPQPPPAQPQHIPLPPSPDRDSRLNRIREPSRDINRDQPSPLERYFAPSPARAIFDRHSPSKRSHFGTPHEPGPEFRNTSTSAASNRAESMPTRQGLRDMLLASMDLLLEDHFITLESNHQAQTRRISHLERSTQDSGLALIQAQADYAALETTLLEDRKRTEGLEKELEKERSLRQAQATDATSLISQLEKQLHSQTKCTASLEQRVSTLTKSLKESQGEIDRLEGEMTKGYSEMNGRLGNIGRLEHEISDWKRRAEEAEFTVRALREEGVRMSRELDKRGKIVEELEKGRKFVTRV
jgi:hypothetical protein